MSQSVHPQRGVKHVRGGDTLFSSKMRHSVSIICQMTLTGCCITSNKSLTCLQLVFTSNWVCQGQLGFLVYYSSTPQILLSVANFQIVKIRVCLTLFCSGAETIGPMDMSQLFVTVTASVDRIRFAFLFYGFYLVAYTYIVRLHDELLSVPNQMFIVYNVVSKSNSTEYVP